MYPNLVQAVVSALQTIFTEDYYADKVIQRLLKSNPKWGSRDRAFLAESVYEIVRWYRLLYTVLGQEPKTEEDWWEMFGVYYLLAGGALPDWKEFSRLDAEQIKKRQTELLKDRKIRESIPDWLDERGAAELGEHWPESIAALNRMAQVVLRTNQLKTTSAELAELLSKDGIETRTLENGGLLVTKRRNLFATKAFKQGLFEVQDFSSQQVAPFLQVEPGMQVVDACAGGGGKSLHLATLMENKGRLLAMDTAAWKLNELKKRARRNGIHIVETRPITNSKVIKRLEGKADRLLLDVPCSGLGVIRRNPDAKWKLSNDFIERVRKEQADILDRYPRMLKPGGLLVYATCSILPSENRKQIDRFLETHPEFELEEDRTILPQDEGFDGFYMARLKKREN
ncbi:RsmB/NOP family class I SAM-dependent RNA methyltransferase [Flavilitoribacter nigricans]|uniref:RsmB/NOP family class I SAM-dependent RNA methyltransferase n=1 Tax=Flavilitoribacter nigricans TaxID=70997 RepID=UPI001C9E398D|nr:RNA methyltransferase [Flavilitoribacter nigricans]